MTDNPTRLGRYENTMVGEHTMRAYVPPCLPPVPPIALTGLHAILATADQALGRLDGFTVALPDPPPFRSMYVRKEALLSSRIDGAQSSLADLLLFETDVPLDAPTDHVTAVSGCVAAIEFGMRRLRDGEKLSAQLLKDVHAVLIGKGPGQDKDPGAFRRSAVWIGGTRAGHGRFVPPPPHLVEPAVEALIDFIHTDHPDLPILVKAALVQAQFENIQPFLVGNGRMGRMLISFLLCEQGVLREPVLFSSLYLKQHRQRYYELLQTVREFGAWEDWLAFFLRGIVDTADRAIAGGREIQRLFARDHEKIAAVGWTLANALPVHALLQRRGLIAIPGAARELGLSQPTVASMLVRLSQLGIARETTGRRRDRIYAYGAYMDILNDGTEAVAA